MGFAMDHLCSSGSVADHRFQDAPFVDELNRYLSHCAAHGARPAVLKVKRNELLWIARHLGPNADGGVGMPELMSIALERQNLRGAATAARRVIDIGRPWLRFLGWWHGSVQTLGVETFTVPRRRPCLSGDAWTVGCSLATCPWPYPQTLDSPDGCLATLCKR